MADDRKVRVFLALVALCGCDHVFRVDRVGPHSQSDGADGALGTNDGQQLPPCLPARSVVGHYPVDGDENSQRLTDHGPNAIHGTSAGFDITTTTGPTDCGLALQVIAAREVTIPYSEAYQLASGSIDLWVRPIVLSSGTSRVIVARDAGGNNPGDFTLFLHRASSGEYMFVVRLQSGDLSNNGGGTIRCSLDTLTTSTTWYHIAVNFGPPDLELLVGDVMQSRPGNIMLNGEQMTCGQSTIGQVSTVGINGAAQRPWFVGYGDVFEAMTLQRVYLSSGGIDNFRISAQRF
jgi:hypothetical protein